MSSYTTITNILILHPSNITIYVAYEKLTKYINHIKWWIVT